VASFLKANALIEANVIKLRKSLNDFVIASPVRASFPTQEDSSDSEQSKQFQQT
jgi:hypothetical protein